VEEIKYANKLIESFLNCTIELPNLSSGITLRGYLSEKLECDPMRITKKFARKLSLGTRIYNWDVCKIPAEVIADVKKELQEYESSFRQKLKEEEHQNKITRTSDPGIKCVSSPGIDALLRCGKDIENQYCKSNIDNFCQMNMIENKFQPFHLKDFEFPLNSPERVLLQKQFEFRLMQATNYFIQSQLSWIQQTQQNDCFRKRYREEESEFSNTSPACSLNSDDSEDIFLKRVKIAQENALKLL
jgi:hypothetical protein